MSRMMGVIDFEVLALMIAAIAHHMAIKPINEYDKGQHLRCGALDARH